MKKDRTMKNECDRCRHHENIPGDVHIMCLKPDPLMTADMHGIKKGWFDYPKNFDPQFKTKMCSNFELKESQDET